MVRIFVPVSFSDYSLNALKYAITLGTKIPSVITLLGCSAPVEDEQSQAPSPQELSIRLNALKEEIEQQLYDQEKKDVTLLTRSEIGYPEDILVEISKKEEPDVIVMGTKSKGETIKELLGSVTSDVVKNAIVPVLAVPAKSSINVEQINHILFVTDFSDNDYRSLHKLIRLITPFETRIYAVHFKASAPDKWDKKRLEEMRYYCATTYRNYEVKFDFITGDNFITSLDKFIALNNIELIAMTRHKRNMISKILHPSITRKILFHTDIPLLVFHE